MPQIHLESRKDKRTLRATICDIFKYLIPFTNIVAEKSYKSLTMPQVEFLVKVMGDWDSDTFDIRDMVSQLVKETRLFEDNYSFRWNSDFDLIDHESKCS